MILPSVCIVTCPQLNSPSDHDTHNCTCPCGHSGTQATRPTSCAAASGQKNKTANHQRTWSSIEVEPMRAREFVAEAASAAQQAAIAINMKKHHKKPKSELEEEQLDELTFMGMSPCTKDCSGHRAGYKWSKARGGVSSASWSNSFNKGAEIARAGY